MYANRVVSLTAATSLENRVLQEPGLSAELQRLANPLSIGGIDAIDFQPCQLHEFRTQDRKCIEHWQMPSGGTWAFTAIFDGQYHLFLFALCAFGGKWAGLEKGLYVQGMRDTPSWSTRLGHFPP